MHLSRNEYMTEPLTFGHLLRGGSSLYEVRFDELMIPTFEEHITDQSHNYGDGIEDGDTEVCVCFGGYDADLYVPANRFKVRIDNSLFFADRREFERYLRILKSEACYMVSSSKEL